MVQNRKETAWKKNKKFGEIHGGRMRLKCADGIFNRKHNLFPPTEDQEKPLFIVENTSRDFYFPITVDEIKVTLKKLPKEHTEYLTHIWLAKVKKSEYLKDDTWQAQFICGSKVYLIKLYAVPKDNKMLFGQAKPTTKQLSFYKQYCKDLHHDKNGWYLQWTTESYKKYYLEKLLLNEIGHSVDYMYQRYWSKTSSKQTDDFANNYAIFWGNSIKQTIEQEND